MVRELAGALKERIVVERRESARDALGGAIGEWIVVNGYWAAIVVEGSGIAVAGEAVSALPRWRVTVRTGADLRMGDRLRWQARVLRVLTIREEVDRWLIDTEEAR